MAFLGSRYCGPYISDDKWQSSVKGSTPARNPLEEACKEHDAFYSTGSYLSPDKNDADAIFMKKAAREGPVGVVFASLVGLQYLTRSVYNRIFPERSVPSSTVSVRLSRTEKEYIARTARVMAYGRGRKRKATSRRRTTRTNRKGLTRNVNSGSMPQLNTGMVTRKAAKPSKQIRSIAAPSAFGTGVVLEPPSVKKLANGVLVSGSEFGGRAQKSLSTYSTTGPYWFLSNIIHLNPNYFANARLGVFTLLYSKFRFRRVIVNYITTCGTNIPGNVLIEYQPNFAETCRNWTSTTFLNQVMGSAGAAMMPVWENFRAVVPVEDSELKYIVPDNEVGLKEQSNGDVYCFLNTSSTSADPGYYVIEYECEFSSPLYSPRYGRLPYADDQGWSYSALETHTARVVNNPVLLINKATPVSGTTAFTVLPGATYKFVLDYTSTAAYNAGLGTPIVISSADWYQANRTGTAATSTGNTLTLKDGFTCFITFDSHAVAASAPIGYVYADYQEAISGSADHSVEWAVAPSADKPFYIGWMILIHAPANYLTPT